MVLFALAHVSFKSVTSILIELIRNAKREYIFLSISYATKYRTQLKLCLPHVMCTRITKCLKLVNKPTCATVHIFALITCIIPPFKILSLYSNTAFPQKRLICMCTHTLTLKSSNICIFNQTTPPAHTFSAYIFRCNYLINPSLITYKHT